MKISNILKPVMANFAQSRTSFYRDRFALNMLMNLLFKVPNVIKDSIQPVQLRSCTAYQITPPVWESGNSILYLHGGAMCLPMWKFYLPIAYNLAKQTKSRVLLPNYRLAPEFPFPAALDDSMDAANWITSNWTTSDELIVIGDSAGGNLALNTAVGINSLNGLALLSPWLDLTNSSKWWNENILDDVVFPSPARRAAWLYTRGAGDWKFGEGNPDEVKQFDLEVRDSRVSPILADLSFATRTPVLIQVGRNERLFGDSFALWEKIGGHVPGSNFSIDIPFVKVNNGHHELSVWSSVPHVWQITRPWTTEAKLAIDQIIQFITRRYTK